MSKVQSHHLERPAYVYVRQSTMGQVRHHHESTERQYALRNRAVEMMWAPERIRILDQDLGRSGAQTTDREDFKTLVADVSLGRVGAIFALEASRLARSNLEWHRLIEICALTRTLVIDEDGCYDPANFNDALLLGLKATIAQAELHVIHARLQGGKLHKAQIEIDLESGGRRGGARQLLRPGSACSGVSSVDGRDLRNRDTRGALRKVLGGSGDRRLARAGRGSLDSSRRAGPLPYDRRGRKPRP